MTIQLTSVRLAQVCPNHINVPYLLIHNICHSIIILQINFHNEFLQDMFKAIASPEQAHVRRCFPEHMKEYVFPTEVNEDVCIVPKAEG